MAKKSKKVTDTLASTESTESTQTIETTEASSALSEALAAPQTDADTARNEVLSFVESTISHVESRLSALNEGEKVSMQTLCAEISETTKVPSERIYHFVSMYVNRRAGVTVARGRDGGIYKGARPSKPIDPKQAEKLQKRAAAAEAKAQALAAEAQKLRERAGNVAAAPPAPPAPEPELQAQA